MGWYGRNIIAYLCDVICSEFSRRKQEVKRGLKDVGVFPALFLSVLAACSFPPGVIHELWKRFWMRWFHPRTAIEGWILFSLLISLIVLCIAQSVSFGILTFLIILVVFRLSDLFYIMLSLLVRWQAPYRTSRSLILILVHYLEVIMAFACFYMFYQNISDSNVFLVHGLPQQLTATQAFHYSLNTATTLGLGDIVPQSGSTPLLWLLWLEVFCMLIITAMDIPRVIALGGLPNNRRAGRRGG